MDDSGASGSEVVANEAQNDNSGKHENDGFGDESSPKKSKSSAVVSNEEDVPVSEAAKRQNRIDTELNGMIKEMMESEDFEEEDEMEPESYEAIMRAAKEICYTRKYYDVSGDKIVFFPSLTKTIVNYDVFEKAEKYYFDEDDEFPSDYSMGLRAVAFERLEAEGDDDSDDEEMDDDMMERLSMAVQLTEDDLDELREAVAAAEAEEQDNDTKDDSAMDVIPEAETSQAQAEDDIPVQPSTQLEEDNSSPSIAEPPIVSESSIVTDASKASESEVIGQPSTQLEDKSSPSIAEPINSKTYDDYSWRKLPLEVQEAAIRLGYTKEMWNEDQEPESSSKYWEELDPEEQEAAKLLGYDKTTWNSEDDEMTPKDYDPLSWKELPKHIQEAYGVLGYDEDLWDRDKSHATLDKDWEELTEAEQKAATAIGYTAETWNEDSNEKGKAEPQNDPAPLVEEPASTKKYEDCSWEELPSEAQDAAKLLGYTEEGWNENKEPDLTNKYWEELKSEQKEAAKVLGYNETLWNFGDKEVSPGDYDDMFWNQLPKKIQEAYQVLGYDEDLWDRDESPAAIDKDWDALTEEERNGAIIVGYTETTWDDDADDEEDDAEPQNELTGIRGQVAKFMKGSSYILLDCMSMAAFFGVIESIFLIGKLFLSDNGVNALKIVFGLSIMQFSGQLRKWLGAEKETKKARSRKTREEITLSRSFLNLFSWWTTFAGVNHFFYAFEKEYLSENGWESMGYFYYCLVFLASALPMWFLFGDNFLKGCDV